MLPVAIRYSRSAIRDLLVRANATPYDIAAVVEEKLANGYGGAAQVLVRGDYEGVAVACGRYLRLLAVDPERRNRGIGTDLLRQLPQVSIIAAEPGNYFTPGIVDTDAATLAFFRKRGYAETARTQNLGLRLAAAFEGSKLPHSRRDDALAFIERTFGPIWRYEANKADTIFYTEDNGRITGFAAQEANNRGLGFFGPTGVDPEYRGRGLGTELLRASLAELERLGYDQAIIPWTDAIDFYRKACGATVAQRFVIMRRIAP